MTFMKNVLYRLILALATGLCGCAPELEVKPSIELTYSQSDKVEMPTEGGEKTIFFTSDHDWYVEVPSDAGWLNASPAAGPAGNGRIKVATEPNMEGEGRTTQLKICCSDEASVTVTIDQKAYVPTFELENDSKSVSAAGGSVEVYLLADIDYSYEIKDDWIKGMGTKAVRKYMHFFSVEPNPEPEERIGTVEFIAGNQKLVYTITQRAAGTEGQDWMYDGFKDRSLAMRFTADWCGYCPLMGTAFETARATLGGSLELVSIHGSGGLEFSDAAKLMSRFKVSGFPTGIVDARANIPNYSSTSTTSQAVKDVVKETTDNFPACTGIAMKSSQTDGNVSAEVTLYVKEADYYRVTVLLLEDNIIAYQNGASNTYDHDHVARVALSDVKGDVINIEKDGTIWTGEYSCTIPEYCDPDNLRLLVIVEKTYGDRKNVKGVPEAEYYNYGDTYVDNCRSAKVGADAALE